MNLNKSLKGLKDQRAPSTLIPGVVARVQAEAISPWWNQMWWIWPLPARAALMAGLTVFAGGVWWTVYSFPVPVETLTPAWHRSIFVVVRVGMGLTEHIRLPLLAAAAWAYVISAVCGTVFLKMAGGFQSFQSIREEGR